MSQSQDNDQDQDDEPSGFWPGLGRAGAAALVFEAPALLTAEMWQLAGTTEPWRLALLFGLLPPLLMWLNGASGFRPSAGFVEDLIDACSSIAVASTVAIVFLACFGILTLESPPSDMAAMVVAMAIPGSVGAALSRAQFGDGDAETEAKNRHGIWLGEVLFMIVGSLVLMLPVAPTDEIVGLAWKMGPTRLAVLAGIILALMHAIVYELKKEDDEHEEERGFWALFMVYTVVGYAVVAVIAAFLLWSFGRLDGLDPRTALRPVIVLSLPGGIGAAIARLLL